MAQTLARLVQARAERLAGRLALTFAGTGGADERISYDQLYSRAQQLAVFLHRRGIGRGDALAVMMHNHPVFVYALVAASMLGAVIVPLDPRARGPLLHGPLRDTGCCALLTTDDLLPQLAGSPALPPLYVWVTAAAGALPQGATALNEAFAGSLRPLPALADAPEQPLEVLYTSGTTGKPKGVVLDNRRVVGFGALGRLFGYRPDDRLYTGLSLAHGNAQAVTLLSALTIGIDAVFTPRFTKSRLWELTRTYGITSFSLLGGMATAIYSEPPRADDGDNPVRLVVSAGMPAALWEAFERRFQVRILEWYGAVEGGFVYKPVGEGPVGSFGRRSPGYAVRVVDEHDRDCPPGVIGELLFRPLEGPAQVTYWRDAAAAAAKVRDGWLRSGDMVYRDAQGYLFFAYRKGEAIRRNGEFIDPALVAKVLAEHPDVSDVFVYGVPAASGAPGEQDLVAAVVPADAACFRAADIFAACRRALPGNAVPTYLQVVTALPKTLSEKPQRQRLAARFSPQAANVVTEAAARAAAAPVPAAALEV
ncbi:MAG: ATP-dependent acyl-CoA ligase [Candidatus Tectimicrobiota bacterium]|nr:MAG: ATP-dependent acyl-CoA ligase [Candidatus Tectomicrobia bacterium]